MNIYEDNGIYGQSAHFGWQKNTNTALYGIREGYKNAADDLVDIVLENGSKNLKMLDTYIFPIMFLYRHSLEIFLKDIYYRAKGQILGGGHDLLSLWSIVKKEIIDDMINSEEFITQVKEYKQDFREHSLDGISLTKIKMLLQELQEANQNDFEIDKSNMQIDNKAEVWRYLMSIDGKLFFKSSHTIDYPTLKESINYIYDVFDNIYRIVNDYLSS
jgi:hypothetical protein